MLIILVLIIPVLIHRLPRQLLVWAHTMDVLVKASRAVGAPPKQPLLFVGVHVGVHR